MWFLPLFGRRQRILALHLKRPNGGHCVDTVTIWVSTAPSTTHEKFQPANPQESLGIFTAIVADAELAH
jgi:hypothetical protein